MRAARFLVTDDLLHQLLLMPKGVNVRNVTWNHERWCYEFSVCGDEESGLPLIGPGCPIPAVEPSYRTVDGKPEFIGWNP